MGVKIIFATGHEVTFPDVQSLNEADYCLGDQFTSEGNEGYICWKEVLWATILNAC